MYKNHNFILYYLEVIALCYTRFCPEHIINTIRDTNLQPLSNKYIWRAFIVSTDSLDF